MTVQQAADRLVEAINAETRARLAFPKAASDYAKASLRYDRALGAAPSGKHESGAGAPVPLAELERTVDTLKASLDEASRELEEAQAATRDARAAHARAVSQRDQAREQAALAVLPPPAPAETPPAETPPVMDASRELRRLFGQYVRLVQEAPEPAPPSLRERHAGLLNQIDRATERLGAHIGAEPAAGRTLSNIERLETDVSILAGLITGRRFGSDQFAAAMHRLGRDLSGLSAAAMRTATGAGIVTAAVLDLQRAIDLMRDQLDADARAGIGTKSKLSYRYQQTERMTNSVLPLLRQFERSNPEAGTEARVRLLQLYAERLARLTETIESGSADVHHMNAVDATVHYLTRVANLPSAADQQVLNQLRRLDDALGSLTRMPARVSKIGTELSPLITLIAGRSGILTDQGTASTPGVEAAVVAAPAPEPADGDELGRALFQIETRMRELPPNPGPDQVDQVVVALREVVAAADHLQVVAEGDEIARLVLGLHQRADTIAAESYGLLTRSRADLAAGGTGAAPDTVAAQGPRLAAVRAIVGRPALGVARKESDLAARIAELVVAYRADRLAKMTGELGANPSREQIHAITDEVRALLAALKGSPPIAADTAARAAIDRLHEQIDGSLASIITEAGTNAAGILTRLVNQTIAQLDDRATGSIQSVSGTLVPPPDAERLTVALPAPLAEETPALIEPAAPAREEPPSAELLERWATVNQVAPMDQSAGLATALAGIRGRMAGLVALEQQEPDTIAGLRVETLKQYRDQIGVLVAEATGAQVEAARPEIVATIETLHALGDVIRDDAFRRIFQVSILPVSDPATAAQRDQIADTQRRRIDGVGFTFKGRLRTPGLNRHPDVAAEVLGNLNQRRTLRLDDLVRLLTPGDGAIANVGVGHVLDEARELVAVNQDRRTPADPSTQEMARQLFGTLTAWFGQAASPAEPSQLAIGRFGEGPARALLHEVAKPIGRTGPPRDLTPDELAAIGFIPPAGPAGTTLEQVPPAAVPAAEVSTAEVAKAPTGTPGDPEGANQAGALSEALLGAPVGPPAVIAEPPSTKGTGTLLTVPVPDTAAGPPPVAPIGTAQPDQEDDNAAEAIAELRADMVPPASTPANPAPGFGPATGFGVNVGGLYLGTTPGTTGPVTIDQLLKGDGVTTAPPSGFGW